MLYFRQTKAECAPWIDRKHQPKPHSASHATTIITSDKRDDLPSVQAWLDYIGARSLEANASDASARQALAYSREATAYKGIVGEPAGVDGRGRTMISPIAGTKAPYIGMWMTGDYDLFQVLGWGDMCEVVLEDSRSFSVLKRKINNALGWAGIQHGPQAQWDSKDEADASRYHDFNMPKEVESALRAKDYDRKVQTIIGRDPMFVLDRPLTVVAGGNAVLRCDSGEDAADALICKGC